MTQETSQEPESFFQKVIENIQDKSDSKMIFGEPIEEEGRKIITVGQIKYRFAGGSGHAKGTNETEPNAETAKEESAPEGGGEGGFGGVKVEPIGVIEITPAETKFIPIIHGREVLIAFMGGFLLAWLLKRK